MANNDKVITDSSKELMQSMDIAPAPHKFVAREPSVKIAEGTVQLGLNLWGRREIRQKNQSKHEITELHNLPKLGKEKCNYEIKKESKMHRAKHASFEKFTPNVEKNIEDKNQNMFKNSHDVQKRIIADAKFERRQLEAIPTRKLVNTKKEYWEERLRDCDEEEDLEISPIGQISKKDQILSSSTTPEKKKYTLTRKCSVMIKTGTVKDLSKMYGEVGLNKRDVKQYPIRQSKSKNVKPALANPVKRKMSVFIAKGRVKATTKIYEVKNKHTTPLKVPIYKRPSDENLEEVKSTNVVTTDPVIAEHCSKNGKVCMLNDQFDGIMMGTVNKNINEYELSYEVPCKSPRGSLTYAKGIQIAEKGKLLVESNNPSHAYYETSLRIPNGHDKRLNPSRENSPVFDSEIDNSKFLNYISPKPVRRKPIRSKAVETSKKQDINMDISPNAIFNKSDTEEVVQCKYVIHDTLDGEVLVQNSESINSDEMNNFVRSEEDSAISPNSSTGPKTINKIQNSTAEEVTTPSENKNSIPFFSVSKNVGTSENLEVTPDDFVFTRAKSLPPNKRKNFETYLREKNKYVPAIDDKNDSKAIVEEINSSQLNKQTNVNQQKEKEQQTVIEGYNIIENIQRRQNENKKPTLVLTTPSEDNEGEIYNKYGLRTLGLMKNIQKTMQEVKPTDQKLSNFLVDMIQNDDETELEHDQNLMINSSKQKESLDKLTKETNNCNVEKYMNDGTNDVNDIQLTENKIPDIQNLNYNQNRKTIDTNQRIIPTKMYDISEYSNLSESLNFNSTVKDNSTAKNLPETERNDFKSKDHDTADQTIIDSTTSLENKHKNNYEIDSNNLDLRESYDRNPIQEPDSEQLYPTHKGSSINYHGEVFEEQEIQYTKTTLHNQDSNSMDAKPANCVDSLSQESDSNVVVSLSPHNENQKVGQEAEAVEIDSELVNCIKEIADDPDSNDLDMRSSEVPQIKLQPSTSDDVSEASKVKAHGRGLGEGKVGATNSFILDTSDTDHGELGVHVVGPESDSVTNTAIFAMDEAADMLQVEYSVLSKGLYSIHLTWDGEHVPGSPYLATVHE